MKDFGLTAEAPDLGPVCSIGGFPPYSRSVRGMVWLGTSGTCSGRFFPGVADLH